MGLSEGVVVEAVKQVVLLLIGLSEGVLATLLKRTGLLVMLLQGAPAGAVGARSARAQQLGGRHNHRQLVAQPVASLLNRQLVGSELTPGAAEQFFAIGCSQQLLPPASSVS